MNLHENISRIKEVMGIITEQISETPSCSSNGCKGIYKGPEFNNQGDIAHQYSNVITKAVSEKLKQLYNSGIYSKVNLNGIQLTTKGMGSGNVVYTVDIPFEQVQNKCDAMTGFAHVGGWNHVPELGKRKSEILNYIPQGKNENVVLGNKLYVSDLTKTPENLQEYWIQWKHRDYQSECENDNTENRIKNTTIRGTDISDLRTKLQQNTKNLSIDPNSVVVDMDKYQVSFREGNQQIKIISLIFDNAGQMDTRLETIKQSNPSMKIIDRGKKNNLDWVLSII